MTQDWPILLAWFPYLPTLLHSICCLDLSLLLPRPTRQQMAEAVIMLLTTSPIHSFPYKHPAEYSNVLACDGSAITKHSHAQCSTTFSVAANGSAFVASLPSSGYNAGILLLGDRLCWVYDPPVCLYDELSIIRLYPTLHNLSVPLVISYTRCCFTRDVFLIPFRSCSGPTPVTDLFSVFLEVLGI